ncbi:hypothetical protein EGW08_019394 [Elysia chlorotica]|uniref:HSF-type DNA-binding domain-containing protein n=1 Tax=Elysia chlorotica TaxID=188477 RepID=A0A433SUE2_ELYCH|nr:hypothetical protein EGW08_019394 [Elysia chlorotica]
MYSTVENSSGNVPAFLVKLWSLVEDPSTDELIHWDTGGTSFHVYDQQRFSREILPLYFKHSNIASFIRQLNMYGFRKVTHIDQGGLKIEKDDLQFQHQFFQKGEQDMLQYIKRKVSNPPVRPAADSLVNPNADEVSRILTDVKQVKAKQEHTDQNLEYIKRENKLLWREVALLRQKHHKQQQIVNKLIQFLVSLVSSSRTGLTIPGLRRMPLAINDTSQVQAQQVQSPAQTQVFTDAGTNNTALASLVQDNLLQSGSSIVGISKSPAFTQASQPAEDSDFIIDQGEYTIESPRGEVLLSPTPSGGGPIIRELTEVLPSSSGAINAAAPVIASNQAINAAVPVLVSNQGKLFAKPGAQLVLTTNKATPMTQGSINFLGLPQVPVQSQSGTSTSTDTTNFLRPSSSTSHFFTPSPAPPSIMSPKIEPGPSLEDALNFGLNIPPSNISTLGKPIPAQSKVSLLPNNGTISLLPNINKKRFGENASEEENSSSPAKKPMTVSARVITPPKVLNASSAPTTGKMMLQSISPAQADSLNSLVQANSDLNTPTVISPNTLPSSSSMAPSALSTNNQNSNDAMALAAAGSNKDGDDPMLASDQLDLLSSDLDGLKGILQDQYKVDPNFLMELFEMSNPWNLEPDKDLEELKAGSDKDGASSSTSGQELVEYNPQDNLFPDLFMTDSLVGDIDDID